jgi:CheY-like chemotaxis protein
MSKTLLLADDSVTVQRVVELTFAHEDIRVVSVGDGRRAVQALDADGADIVLVDVEVPEIDGYAVAAHVKRSAKLRDVPVLLMAGALGPVDEAKARQLGCAGVLIKPFEPDKLVARVRELLQQAPAARPPAAASGSIRPARYQAERGRAADLPPGDGARARLEAVPGAPVAEPPEAPRRISLGSPEPLEPSRRPVWDPAGAPARPAADPVERPAAAPPAKKPSLVSAFSALLAAEQQTSRPAPDPAPADVRAVVSDAAIEDAVRRVLSRLTGDMVRQIVAETAERLVREEIEKIKNTPE